MIYFFFFKQKTAYELRISDGSSDVCSSDLSFPSALMVDFDLEDFEIVSYADDSSEDAFLVQQGRRPSCSRLDLTITPLQAGCRRSRSAISWQRGGTASLRSRREGSSATTRRSFRSDPLRPASLATHSV